MYISTYITNKSCAILIQSRTMLKPASKYAANYPKTVREIADMMDWDKKVLQPEVKKV